METEIAIKEGLFSKRGGGFPFLWQERKFKLYPSKLEYYVGEKLKGSVKISHNSSAQLVSNISEKPNAFSLKTANGDLLMSGSSKQLSSEWVDAINDVVSKSEDISDPDENSGEEGEVDDAVPVTTTTASPTARSTGNTVQSKSVLRHFTKHSMAGVAAVGKGLTTIIDAFDFEDEEDEGRVDDGDELQNRRKFGGSGTGTGEISVVQYGDVMTFESDGSFLSVDVCGNVVWLAPESGFRVPRMFERCLWQVSTKLSYTDQEFLEAAQKQGSFSSEEMQNMKVQADHERSRNKAEVAKMGQVLLYGDVIQLLHVVTGQYLAAKSTAARINRDCLGLQLTHGASAAYFRTLPRYKVRKEGGSVLMNDVILLSSLSNSGFYVHRSGSGGSKGEEGASLSAYKNALKAVCEEQDKKGPVCDVVECKEANLSRMLYDCGIAVNIYSHPDPGKDAEFLHVSQCMRLFDRENDGFLFADCGLEVGKTAPVMRTLSREGNPNHPGEFVSGAVWSVEFVDGRNVGGLVEWSKPIYRIRHTPTNTFLTVKEDEVPTAGNANDGNYVSLTLEHDSLDPRLLACQSFSFNISESKRDYVPRSDTFVLVTHRSSVTNQEYFLHYAKSNNSFVMSDLFNVYNALLLVPVSSRLQDMVRHIADVQPLLKTYVSAFENPDGICLPQRTFELDEEVAILRDLILRCQDSPPATATVGELEDLLGPPSAPFQDCAREQMLVDVLLDMVVAPVNYGLALDFKFNTEKKKKDWIDPAFKVISTVHKLAWTCLKNLVRKNTSSCAYAAAKELMYKGLVKDGDPPGTASKRTAAKTGIVPICVEQIPHPVLAARFLNNMITDSKLLLQQVATPENITYFRDMVIKYGARASFMNFFTAICSCNGEAIPRNQDLLVKELILNLDIYRQVFIHTYVNPVDDRPYKKWTVATGPGEMEDYYGKGELEQLGGFPCVYVAWTGSDPWVPGKGLYPAPAALDMSTAFDKNGKAHVTLEELCWVLEPEAMCPKLKGITFTEYTKVNLNTPEKREIFDDHVKLAMFYESSIKAMAEMIVNRNYKAIMILEQLFPYVMLIGIISNKRLSYCIRGGFVSIVQRLWVDRFPCEPNCGRESLPDVVWVYEDLKKLSIDDAESFPNFEVGDHQTVRKSPHLFYNTAHQYKYRLLRMFVQKYLSEYDASFIVANKSENMCITRVMALVSDLVSFGFYSTRDKLESLLQRLLPILDGRTDVYESEDSEKASVLDISRYRRSEENNLVMQAKVSILSVITQALNMRQQFRLSGLMCNFKVWSSQLEENLQRTDFDATLADMRALLDSSDAKDNALNLENLTVDMPVDAIFFDLMMYDDVELFESTFRIFERENTMRASLIATASRCFLLDDDTLPVYGSLSIMDDSLSDIMIHIQSTSLWSGDGTHITDQIAMVDGLAKLPVDALATHTKGKASFTVHTKETYDEIWSHLTNMREFLTTSPKSAHQKLCQKYDADSILMSALHWTHEEAAAGRNGFSEAVSREGCTDKYNLYAVAEECLSLLFFMTEGNKTNRAKFRQYATSLVEQSKLFPTKIFALLSEIFSGDKQQVSTTPDYLFAAFAELLLDNAEDDDIVALNFFRNQLLPDPKNPDPIPRNQMLVAQHLLPTMKKSQSLFSFKNVTTDGQLRDHVKGVEVLARCCRDNGTVGAQMSNIALTWTTAAERLNRMFKHAVFPFADKSIAKIPANLGIRTKTNAANMTGTAEQCIWFIHAYVRYLSWMYFDGTAAIDLHVLNDDAMILLICNLAHFVFSSLSWRPPDPDPDFPDREFEENPLGIPTECNLLDVLFDFFKDYLTSLYNAGGKSRSKITEAVRLACTKAANKTNRINSIISSLFSTLHLPVSDLLLTEQAEETGRRNSSMGRKSNQSEYDSPIEALNENYQQYLEEITRHPEVQTRLTVESRDVIDRMLKSVDITDPENREYVRKISKGQLMMDLQFSDITSGVGGLVSFRENFADTFSGGVTGLAGNVASGVTGGLSTVAGGLSNVASGVAGGLNNVASGNFEMSGLAGLLDDDEGDGSRVEEKRTNKVTWGDVVRRMIRYIEKKVATFSPHVCTVRILDLFCVYLGEGEEKDLKLSAKGVLDEDLFELAEVQKELNRYGVMDVCLLLLSTYDSGDVYEATLRLAEMLLKNGNKMVQDAFVSWCKNNDPEGEVFAHLRGTLLEAVRWVEATRYDPASSIKPVISAADIVPCRLVLSLLSQLCEGHNGETQHLLSDQSAIKQYSFNLVRPVVALLHTLCPRREVYRKIIPVQITLASAVLDCLVEITQGPCVANQEEIGTHATFNSLKIILTVPPTVRYQHMMEMVSIQTMAITLCAACLEGEANRAVAEAMVSKVDSGTLTNAYEGMYEFYQLALRSSVVDSVTKGTKQALNNEILHEYVQLKQKEAGCNSSRRGSSKARKSVVIVENIKDVDLEDDENEEHEESEELEAETLCLTMRNLLAVHKYLSLNIPSYSSLEYDEGSMPDFHADFEKELGLVEVFWQGKTYEVRFPLPEEAAFLSETTKEKYMEEQCVLTTSETRVKDLMATREELLDDMSVLRDISNIAFFKFILDNYTEIRNFLYIVVILINFDLTLSLSHGSTIINGYGEVDANGKLLIILGLILLVGYGSMAIYWGFQVSLLNYRRLSRILKTAMVKEQEEKELAREAALELEFKAMQEEMQEEMSHGVIHRFFTGVFKGISQASFNLFAPIRFLYAQLGKGWDLTVFRPTVFIAGAFVVACFMHYHIFKEISPRVLESYMKSYALAGVIIIGPLALYTVRQMIETPYTYIDLLICMVYDLVFDIRFLTYGVFTAAVVFGLAGYHFLYTIVLLEFLNMSVYARNTIKSVTGPWKPLLNVGFIFLIVSQIYGVFAYARFGGNEALIGGDIDDDWIDSCDSIFNCLALVYYEGIRSLDTAALLPDSPVNDERSFTGRFFYDMSFYVIAGCLLWNMVTGIIVDSFGNLRDESAEKDALLNQESFISGLEEDDLETTSLYLEDIKETHQNPWQYLFFAIYLTRKNSADCDGIESYCLNCIHEEKTDWFPTKTCVELERVGANKDDGDEDPSVQVMNRLDKMEGILKKLDEVSNLDKRMSKIEDLLVAMADSNLTNPK